MKHTGENNCSNLGSLEPNVQTGSIYRNAKEAEMTGENDGETDRSARRALEVILHYSRLFKGVLATSSGLQVWHMRLVKHMDGNSSDLFILTVL